MIVVISFFSSMAASFVLVNEPQLAVKATLAALNIDKDTIEKAIHSVVFSSFHCLWIPSSTEVTNEARIDPQGSTPGALAAAASTPAPPSPPAFTEEQFEKFAGSSSLLDGVQTVLDKSFGESLRQHLPNALIETLPSIIAGMLNENNVQLTADIDKRMEIVNGRLDKIIAERPDFGPSGQEHTTPAAGPGIDPQGSTPGLTSTAARIDPQGSTPGTMASTASTVSVSTKSVNTPSCTSTSSTASLHP